MKHSEDCGKSLPPREKKSSGRGHVERIVVCAMCDMRFTAIGNRTKYCTQACSYAASKVKRKASGYRPPYNNSYKLALNLRLRSNREHNLVRLRRRAIVRQVREVASAYKLEKGCADCGYRASSVALQFDHVFDGKKRNVSSMTSLRQFYAEIEICEVVCANCHAIRTHARLPRIDIFEEK